VPNNAETSAPEKGMCYGNSFALFEAACITYGGLGLDRVTVMLCHGIATQTVPPHARMGHAWVEIGVGSQCVCIDHKFPDIWIPRWRYYEIGRINMRDVRRYNLREARHESAAHPDLPYGPWDPWVAAAAHAEDE
jgi:hypothetical protein